MFGNVDYLAQSLNHASLMTDLSVKKAVSLHLWMMPVKLSSLNQGAGGVEFGEEYCNESFLEMQDSRNSTKNTGSYVRFNKHLRMNPLKTGRTDI